MAHHANYSAVLALQQSLAQQILRVYYADGAFPARLTYSANLPNKKDDEGESYPKRKAELDLFLSEPILDFSPRADNAISINLRFLGVVNLSGATYPTSEVKVQIDLKVRAELEVFDIENSIQVGVSRSLQSPSLESMHIMQFSGPPLLSTYHIDIDKDFEPLVAAALLTLDVSNWRISPPQLDEIRSAGFVPKPFPDIKCFGDSVTIGIDVEGLTSGSKGELIDLFKTSVPKGFYRVLSESGSSYDDEYGGQYTEPAWSNISRKSSGPHPVSIAASINPKIIRPLFDRVYGPEIIARFEEIKEEKIEAAKKKAQEKNKPFKKPKIAKTTINSIHLKLIQDFIVANGEAHYEWGAGITVDFEIKFRFLNTYVDGSTNFVYNNSKVAGLKIEIQQIEIDEPWIIDFMNVMTGIHAGIAPPSIVLAGIVMAIITSVVGNKRNLGENKIEKGLVKRIGEFNGKLDFTLPKSNNRKFRLSINDLVVNTGGFNLWAIMYAKDHRSIYLQLKKYPWSTSWPVKDRNSIVVELVHKYSFSHPDDPTIRIRWEIFGDSTANLIVHRDTLLKTKTYKDEPITPLEISIAHQNEDLEAIELFIIHCRVYRPNGTSTSELFKATFKVWINDRLKRHLPYVKWSRGVYFKGYTHKKGHPDRQPMGWMQEMRHYAIHKTDPDERCLFVDQYTFHFNKYDLTYLESLPFAESDMHKHLDKICEYCFFGGPDKVSIPEKTQNPERIERRRIRRVLRPVKKSRFSKKKR